MKNFSAILSAMVLTSCNVSVTPLNDSLVHTGEKPAEAVEPACQEPEKAAAEPEETADEPAADNAEFVSKSAELINTFYGYYVFDNAEDLQDYPSISSLCSPRMLQWLRDGYDYEGDGYAVWLFRSGINGDGYNNVSKVNGISQVMDDNLGGCNWFEVNLTDMGIRVRKFICIVEYPEGLRIDGLKTVREFLDMFEGDEREQMWLEHGNEQI